MKVSELLSLIQAKARLNEAEVKELEKSLFEIINAKLVKKFGEEFDQNQQQNFIEGLKAIKKEQNPSKMTQALKQAGFDPNKAKEYIDLATKQAFEEIVNILGDRITSNDKEEINRLIV